MHDPSGRSPAALARTTALAENARLAVGGQQQRPRVPAAGTGRVRVYTDGACRPNPGLGGWGWVTEGGGWADYGYGGWTTNQRMELTAALEALQCVAGPVTVVSDSQYLINCFDKRWWAGWERRGWRTSGGSEVANLDIWQPLVALAGSRDVVFEWTRGHDGNRWNEAADHLAVRGVSAAPF
jgi:ribonuclease HI